MARQRPGWRDLILRSLGILVCLYEGHARRGDAGQHPRPRVYVFGSLTPESRLVHTYPGVALCA